MNKLRNRNKNKKSIINHRFSIKIMHNNLLSVIIPFILPSNFIESLCPALNKLAFCIEMILVMFFNNLFACFIRQDIQKAKQIH